MIRCLIVDDEQHAIDLLESYVKQVPFLQLVGTATNPMEALQLVSTQKAELVFLDIMMPELTGIQFMKICGKTSKFILSTAYSDYAIEGYEHDVVDYLLKPIPFDRFLKAVQKAQNMIQQQQDISQHSPVPPSTTIARETSSYMFVKGESKNKFLKVNYEDILFVEGLKNYVSFFLPGERLVTYQSLTHLAEELPQPPFYRVHRSYIISIDKVNMVDGNTIYIGNKAIPLGETYREKFLNMIRERNREQ